MQVISRSVNEGLVIGDGIVVTVLEIQDNFVRLGIETPDQFPFYREELLYFGDDGDWECDPQENEESELEPAGTLAAL